MTTVNEDIDAISADSTPLTLESGFPIKVLRIRTRATLSLLKILFRGAGEALSSLRFGEDTSEEEFTSQLLFAVVLAIPEAEEETIEFLNRIVEPGDLIDKPRLTPGDIEWNQERYEILQAELHDPELEDLVTIVSEIVKIEAPHVMALGKRIAALLPMAKKVEDKAATKKAPAKKRAPRASASSKTSSEG